MELGKDSGIFYSTPHLWRKMSLFLHKFFITKMTALPSFFHSFGEYLVPTLCRQRGRQQLAGLGQAWPLARGPCPHRCE